MTTSSLGPSVPNPVTSGFISRPEADHILELLPPDDSWELCKLDHNAHCYMLPLAADPLLPLILQRYSEFFTTALQRQVDTSLLSMFQVCVNPVSSYSDWTMACTIDRSCRGVYLCSESSGDEMSPHSNER